MKKWIKKTMLTGLAVLAFSAMALGNGSSNTTSTTSTTPTDTPESERENLAIGESVTLKGITVTVNSVTETETSTGSPAYEVNVTYVNNSSSLFSANPYDWTTVLHSGSDKAHVGGSSFNLNSIKKGEEWSAVVTLWKDKDSEKIKFESSSLNIGEDNDLFATWLLPDADSGASSEGTIYENAEILDLMTGDGSKVNGSMSLVKASQADCTEEALADWYFNYVEKHSECNYHIIVYSDNPEKGCYANGFGFIQKDISLIQEADGTYYTGDDAGVTYYEVNSDTKTITARGTMVDASVIEDVKTKVDSVIPKEYKDSKSYAIDIAGEEGNLDCNITIVSSSFENADCQKIAVDLATKVKELNLGIGYFNVVFQTDDYNVIAISAIDDLSNQEPTEISTRDL